MPGPGDERAWSELVARYDRLVRHVVRAHGIDVSTSEDIVQVTWCRLVQHLDRVRQPERLGAWLARTARNECLHVLRGWGRETPVEDDALRALIHELGDDREDDLDPAGLEDVVMRAFHTLDDEQRGLLRLVLLTEPKPSYEQISAALGRPIGSIGPTLGRCIDKLRRATLRLSEADAGTRSRPTATRDVTSLRARRLGGRGARRTCPDRPSDSPRGTGRAPVVPWGRVGVAGVRSAAGSECRGFVFPRVRLSACSSFRGFVSPRVLFPALPVSAWVLQALSRGRLTGVSTA